jgi:hypothetical protein
MPNNYGPLFEQLRAVSMEARKLFCVVVEQAYHGPMRSKSAGVATPPEILEACGLDVGDFYSLLASLKDEKLIEVSGEYPFEEIRLTTKSSAAAALAEQCREAGLPLQEVIVTLQTNFLRQ